MQELTTALLGLAIIIIGVIGVEIRGLIVSYFERIIAQNELREAAAQHERAALLTMAVSNATALASLENGGTKDAVKAALSESGIGSLKGGQDGN